jgi:Protein of unknown function (DUF2911)
MGVVAAFAQESPKDRKSPHAQVNVSLGGSPITIDYGRPYLHGRKAVGGTLVPYGQVWRTGADEASKLTTPVDLMIGDLHVPAGSYALFTLATADGWTLIVDKKWDQWGAFTYDKASDLGRVPMKMSKPSGTVEQFTMAFNKTGEKSATLSLTWENTVASVDIHAK